jgi:hypothetical protein
MRHQLRDVRLVYLARILHLVYLVQVVLALEHQDELHQLADDTVQTMMVRHQTFRHLVDVQNHPVSVVDALQIQDVLIRDVVLTFHLVHLVDVEHRVLKHQAHLVVVVHLDVDHLDVVRPVLKFQMDYFRDVLADEVQVELCQMDYFRDVHLQQEED